jgi:hypothetical protein
MTIDPLIERFVSSPTMSGRDEPNRRFADHYGCQL